MTEPKRSKKLPKDVTELTDDEIMRRVFGKREADKLKKEAHKKDIDESERE